MNSLLRTEPWRSQTSRLAPRLGIEQAGSVMIETTLAYVVMITFVLAIIEFSMMGYTYSIFAEAARQGVRYASFHGTGSTNCSGPSTGCADSSGSNVVSSVTQYGNIFAGNVNGLRVNVSYPDGSSAPPSRVLVTVTYIYKPMFDFPGLGQPFQVSSQGRIFY